MNTFHREQVTLNNQKLIQDSLNKFNTSSSRQKNDLKMQIKSNSNSTNTGKLLMELDGIKQPGSVMSTTQIAMSPPIEEAAN